MCQNVVSTQVRNIPLSPVKQHIGATGTAENIKFSGVGGIDDS